MPNIGNPRLGAPWQCLPLLPLLACLLTGCPVTQDQYTPVPPMEKREAVTGGKYYLYVPSTYAKDRRYPLVVTLHGSHGFDSGHQQMREWKALAEKHELIVLAPQLDSPALLPSTGWLKKTLPEDERKVLAEVREVKRNYSIDDNQVMLTAFSAGGYAMYYIGLRNPEVFRYLVARSADWDGELAKSIEITDKVRAMKMLISYGKTGVSPVYSQWSPIFKESWEAYRFLRERHCNVSIRGTDGGHDRRPDVAYDFWAKRH